VNGKGFLSTYPAQAITGGYFAVGTHTYTYTHTHRKREKREREREGGEGEKNVEKE
jgi:hypothetical protein